MKTLVRAILFLTLTICTLAGYWAYLGYFGGALFVPVKATAAVSPARAQIAAVIISGDMGFKVGMGPQIAARLAADGIPVLGVNSLVYFRNRRSPDEIRQLIADSVRRGLTHGHARKLVLIGQSFGADMVHVGLVALPAVLKHKVAMVALIVPTDNVNYQASPMELLNLVPPDAPALPTARQLNWVPTLCVYGREETDSLCPQLTAPNVRRIALPGGHPLHRDADALYGQLITAINAARAKPGKG
jgi:type IV secretory pathway VirJ component